MEIMIRKLMCWLGWHDYLYWEDIGFCVHCGKVKK